jgi:hypothetical protein
MNDLAVSVKDWERSGTARATIRRYAVDFSEVQERGGNISCRPIDTRAKLARTRQPAKPPATLPFWQFRPLSAGVAEFGSTLFRTSLHYNAKPE